MKAAIKQSQQDASEKHERDEAQKHFERTGRRTGKWLNEKAEAKKEEGAN